MNAAPMIPMTLRLAGAALAAALAGCAAHPVQQLADARTAIAAATVAGATDDASSDLRRAATKLALAPRWVAAKDHEAARWLAEQAQVDAELALAKAGTLKAERAVQAARRQAPTLRTALSNLTGDPS